MSWTVVCPENGRYFVPGPGEHACRFCGGQHVAIESGVPPSEGGRANLPPPFKHHFSWWHGRRVTSWSDLRKADKELGLVPTGEKPHKSGRWGGGRIVFPLKRA